MLLTNDAAKNESFMEAALTYTEELVVSAEIVRLVPKMFRPYVLRSTTPEQRPAVLTAITASSGA